MNLKAVKSKHQRKLSHDVHTQSKSTPTLPETRDYRKKRELTDGFGYSTIGTHSEVESTSFNSNQSKTISPTRRRYETGIKGGHEIIFSCSDLSLKSGKTCKSFLQISQKVTDSYYTGDEDPPKIKQILCKTEVCELSSPVYPVKIYLSEVVAEEILIEIFSFKYPPMLLFSHSISVGELVKTEKILIPEHKKLEKKERTLNVLIVSTLENRPSSVFGYKIKFYGESMGEHVLGNTFNVSPYLKILGHPIISNKHRVVKVNKTKKIILKTEVKKNQKDGSWDSVDIFLDDVDGYFGPILIKLYSDVSDADPIYIGCVSTTMAELTQNKTRFYFENRLRANNDPHYKAHAILYVEDVKPITVNRLPFETYSFSCKLDSHNIVKFPKNYYFYIDGCPHPKIRFPHHPDLLQQLSLEKSEVQKNRERSRSQGSNKRRFSGKLPTKKIINPNEITKSEQHFARGRIARILGTRLSETQVLIYQSEMEKKPQWSQIILPVSLCGGMDRPLNIHVFSHDSNNDVYVGSFSSSLRELTLKNPVFDLENKYKSTLTGSQKTGKFIIEHYSANANEEVDNPKSFNVSLLVEKVPPKSLFQIKAYPYLQNKTIVYGPYEIENNSKGFELNFTIEEYGGMDYPVTFEILSKNKLYAFCTTTVRVLSLWKKHNILRMMSGSNSDKSESYITILMFSSTYDEVVAKVNLSPKPKVRRRGSSVGSADVKGNILKMDSIRNIRKANKSHNAISEHLSKRDDSLSSNDLPKNPSETKITFTLTPSTSSSKMSNSPSKSYIKTSNEGTDAEDSPKISRTKYVIRGYPGSSPISRRTSPAKVRERSHTEHSTPLVRMKNKNRKIEEIKPVDLKTSSSSEDERKNSPRKISPVSSGTNSGYNSGHSSPSSPTASRDSSPNRTATPKLTRKKNCLNFMINQTSSSPLIDLSPGLSSSPDDNLNNLSQFKSVSTPSVHFSDNQPSPHR